MADNTDNKTFAVSYNPEIPCVVMTWQGYASSEEIREGSLDTLLLLREKKVSKVIADTRNMKLITAQDRQWISEVFIPQAAKEGFRVCAFVKSTDYHNRLSVENITYKIDPKQLNVEWFDTFSDAENWLKETEV